MNRREALLGSLVAVAVALLAPGLVLGIGALRIAGWVVAGLAAIEGARIVFRRTKVEGHRETDTLAHRTKVPIAQIAEIDPTQVGIDAAAQSILPGEAIPEYVPRDVDAELREAIQAALGGEGRRIVIVCGQSKVGKSRTLFEALAACREAAEVGFVAPTDAVALRSLTTPGEMPLGPSRGSVLWLDDLEPFLNEGVTLQTLRGWCEQVEGPCVVVATYGGKGSIKVRDSAGGAMATLASEIFQHAREVSLEMTSAGEIASMQSMLSQDAIGAIQEHGLAAYLVAGPELERKLSTRLHPGDADPCPEGYAVVRAVVDWARAGRTDAIGERLLREVIWPDYLPPGSRQSDDAFRAGVDWATRPVAGSIALVEDSDGLRPFDYVVKLIAGKPSESAPHDSVWANAIAGVDWARAMAVANQAYGLERYEDACAAIRIARDSGPPDVAAVAGFNLGIALTELNRLEDALVAFEEVLARFGEDEDPGLRESVARALLSKGTTLADLDRLEDALVAFEEVLVRFAEDEEPEIRLRVANALLNKGVGLAKLNRFEDALVAFEEVLARFAEDEEPGFEEIVASALISKATTLGELDRPEDALATYEVALPACEEILTRFEKRDDPELKEIFVNALFNKGIALVKLDRNEDALASYEDLLARFAEDEEPGIRLRVANALFSKGALLAKLGRPEDALVSFEEVLSRVDSEKGREFEKVVARALVGKGSMLVSSGQGGEALPLLDRAIEYFDALGDAAMLGRARELRDGLRGMDQRPDGRESR